MFAFSSLFLAFAVLTSPPAPDLSWLTGRWLVESGDASQEEIWGEQRGGLMLGVNRTMRGDRAVAFEYLRITSGESVEYCAQPGGAAATCFELADHDAGWAVFENPEHDYPQRIAYRLEGDQLTATLSDISGGQVMSWTWRRAE